MRRHSYLPLLATFVAATVASGQQPSAPPATDPAPSEREQVDDATDARLGLEVQARLYQELNVSNLSALVRYGVATLDGMVRSEADIQRAERIALEIRGVHTVVNQLSVAAPLSIAVADEAAAVRKREGESLESEVAARLNADAVLGSRSISVVADEVTNTVTLTGTVSTQEEKERAALIAAGAFPAGQLRNQIEVQQRL